MKVLQGDTVLIIFVMIEDIAIKTFCRYLSPDRFLAVIFQPGLVYRRISGQLFLNHHLDILPVKKCLNRPEGHIRQFV